MRLEAPGRNSGVHDVVDDITFHDGHEAHGNEAEVDDDAGDGMLIYMMMHLFMLLKLKMVVLLTMVVKPR